MKVFIGQHKSILLGALILIISASVFSFLQFSTPHHIGYDVFYHVKIAEIIRDQGITKNFPWLFYTVLHKNYADQHFLFHVVLVPFLSFGRILGPKIAAIILGSLTLVVFFWFLERNKVKYAFWWTLLLLISSQTFLLRISLVSVLGISLILLLLITHCIFKKKYLPREKKVINKASNLSISSRSWFEAIIKKISLRGLFLFLLSFIFVWFYGGFIFLFIPVFSYLLVALFIEKKFYYKVLLMSVSGVIIGIIAHPNFPNILDFLKIQILETKFINNVSGGAEWISPSLDTLLYKNFLVIIGLAITLAFVIYFLFIKKKIISEESIVLLIISLVFNVLSIKSVRFVDHWIPFSILFMAFAWNDLLKFYDIKKSLFCKDKRIFIPIVSFLAVIIFTVGIYNVYITHIAIADTRNRILIEEASMWIKDNVSKKEIIYNADWDDFPPLFFYNSNNYYISGLDPAFMRVYNKDLFDKYENIGRGKDFSNIEKILQEDFNSKYIIFDKEHKKLERYLRGNKNFDLVFENDEYRIYEFVR